MPPDPPDFDCPATGRTWLKRGLFKMEKQTKYGDDHSPQDITTELLSACEYMINITGGSAIWDGETHIALKKIEVAVFNAKGMMNTVNQKAREHRAKYREYHGKSRTPEYNVWAQMIQRCINPNNPAYKNYGDREITICDRWRNSFEAFYEDMGSIST